MNCFWCGFYIPEKEMDELKDRKDNIEEPICLECQREFYFEEGRSPTEDDYNPKEGGN